MEEYENKLKYLKREYVLKIALLREVETETDHKKQQIAELKKLIKLKKDIVTEAKL
jgi:ABC-type Zn uptake system ZnuABC Zn-binding protein ZnuA